MSGLDWAAIIFNNIASPALLSLSCSLLCSLSLSLDWAEMHLFSTTLHPQLYFHFHVHFNCHFHLTEVKYNHFQQHRIHHFTFISTFICPFTFNFTWLSWAAIIFNNIASTTSLSFCSRKLDLQRTVDKFKLDFYSPSPSLARDINLRYWIWRADYFQHFSWSVGRKDGWDQ